VEDQKEIRRWPKLKNMAFDQFPDLYLALFPLLLYFTAAVIT
jgi:hypothetical protein